MARGLLLPFPAPSGLTEDDLERLYRFVTGSRGGQVDIMFGPTRRTSAILAMAGRQLKVDRVGDTISVLSLSSSRPPPDDSTAEDLQAEVATILRQTGNTPAASAEGSGDVR